jgi:hypothetical protein
MTFTKTTFSITICNIINNKILIIQHSVLCVVMLRVAFSSCHAECRYAKYRHAKCHHAKCHYAQCHYAKRRYAKYRYAKCRYAKCHLCHVLFMPSVIMPSVIMPSVVMPSIIMPSVVMPSVVMPSVVASLNEMNSSFERIFCSFSFQSFQFIFSFILFTLFASSYVPPGNPYLKGRLSTVDLIVLTNLDRLLLQLQK